MNFGGNKLKTMPEATNWTQVTRLSLHWNTMVVLPSLQPMAATLGQLQLQGNRLTALPKLGWAPQMQLLDACNNLLASLPGEVGRWAGLVTLKLSHNKLTSIPETIGSLLLLEELHVDNNELTALPPTIGSCRALKVLNASNNKLTHLTGRLGDCPALGSIDFDHNPIDATDAATMATLAILRTRCTELGGYLKSPIIGTGT